MDYSEKYGRYEKFIIRKIDEHYYQKRHKEEEIDYTQKVVLDIGGNEETVNFFLDNGALHVTLISTDSDLCKKLESETQCTPINKIINNMEEISALILQYKPHIVKADLDGREIVLFTYKNKPLIFPIPELFILECYPSPLQSVLIPLYQVFLKEMMILDGITESSKNELEFENIKHIIAFFRRKQNGVDRQIQ